jgi:hypothetical protein
MFIVCSIVCPSYSSLGVHLTIAILDLGLTTSDSNSKGNTQAEFKMYFRPGFVVVIVGAVLTTLSTIIVALRYVCVINAVANPKY